jgi:flavin reductase (DIM6/NTAB) family NADH-FMN oxidoreductase RutF
MRTTLRVCRSRWRILSSERTIENTSRRFHEGDWGTAETGAPVLKDALAWLDCRIHGRHQAGTHTIYVGEVAASAVPDDSDQPPLVYWNRGYRKLRLHEPEE